MVVKDPFIRPQALGGDIGGGYPWNSHDDSQLVSVSHLPCLSTSFNTPGLVSFSLPEALLSAKQGLLCQGFFQQRSCLDASMGRR